MPNYTENYNLKKPLPNENYNVQDQNDNMDIIDTALKAHDDALATKETPQGAQEKADAALASAKDYTDQQISAITPEQIGAETPAGAQAKAEAALAAAKQYTDQAALPKSGGSMSGELNMQDNLLTRPYIKDYAESCVASTGVSGTKTLDITTGNVFDLTLSGNTTLAFSNPSASGRACSITVIIRMPSTLYAVTWPSSVKWAEDNIPELKANKTAIFTFVTVNAGSRWYGMCAGTDFTT